MEKGFEVEFEFISYFNRRMFKNLDPISQELFRELYPDIDEDDVIRVGKYEPNAKADLIVEVDGYKRGISIKSGQNASCHLERISHFTNFLEANGFKMVDELKRYLFADGTNDNTGPFRMSAAEYKQDHAEELAALNEELERYRYMLLRRFLIDYRPRDKVKVDAFIFGTVDDFMYATEKEVMTYLMMEPPKETTGVAVSNLFLQNWNRNLKYNPAREGERYFVQVKWYDIQLDVLKIEAERMLKKEKLKLLELDQKSIWRRKARYIKD